MSTEVMKSWEQIITEVADKNSEWSVIMDNILAPNYYLKPELISELAIQFYNQKNYVEQTYEQGYFRFYFISTCSKLVKQNKSGFHTNCRMTLESKHNKYFNEILEEMNSGYSVQEHKQLEQKIATRLEAVNQAMKSVEPKCTWIQNEMARLHYKEGMSFRQIEKHYEGSIRYNRAHQIFQEWNVKFKEELKKYLKNEQ